MAGLVEPRRVLGLLQLCAAAVLRAREGFGSRALLAGCGVAIGQGDDL